MIMNVVNKEIRIGNIKVTSVSSSSTFLVGDTEIITLASIFNTPPESLIIGPLVSLAPGR
jgi:spore germination protein PD